MSGEENWTEITIINIILITIIAIMSSSFHEHGVERVVIGSVQTTKRTIFSHNTHTA